MGNVKTYNNLNEAIKENGYTLQQFASILGIERNALYRKINKGVKFTKLEKEKIKELLNLDIE